MARHLETGCAVCNNEFRSITSVMAGLASSIPPVDPAPDLKQRLLARIGSEEQVKEQPEPGMYIVRSGSGKWRQSPWNGISYQRLYTTLQPASQPRCYASIQAHNTLPIDTKAPSKAG